MTVREDTIKELTATEITQWIGRPTHASVELMRKVIAKKAAAIKTWYEPFPEGTRYGFAAAIMLSAYNRKRVTTLDLACTFQVPDIPVTYDLIIDGQTSETNKAKRDVDWEVHREGHEVYLRVEDAIKHLIITAYNACWLDEIKDDVLNLTRKTAKEMLAHLLTQCMKLTNQEKCAKLKETEFPWLAEEDV